MERIPGVSEVEWNALPPTIRVFIELRLTELELQAAENVELRARCAALELRVSELEAKLAKNSRNSHKPPSSDGPAKPPRTQSERTASGRKPGGQGGHSGSTLRRRENPDSRVRHRVDECQGCARDLSGQKPDKIRERQVVDLPPMKLLCTAHEQEIKTCSNCGKCNEAELPVFLTSETGAVIYGPELRALCVYLSAGQYVPYQRISDFMFDLFGQKISTGTLTSWTEKAHEGLAVTEQAIVDQLAASEGPVHFDETGIRVEKANHWLHSASNLELTYYGFHEKRGSEAMEKIGILPRFTGTAIHDRWESYFKYDGCDHGLCGAHLLRDLRFAWECERERWAKNLRRLFGQMNMAVKEAKSKGQTRFNGPTLEYWRKRYQRILAQGFRHHAQLSRRDKNSIEPIKRGRKKQRYGKNLLDALKTHQESVLLFIHDFSIPFTNNQGERDIRMSKVKLKISGCFRTKAGAKQFCRIRGYLSTARKQSWSLLQAMRSVFLGSPLQPVCV